jgi:hypothetical protein
MEPIQQNKIILFQKQVMTEHRRYTQVSILANKLFDQYQSISFSSFDWIDLDPNNKLLGIDKYFRVI